MTGADLQPGGVIKVTYTAKSPIGVWRTAVLVSGPCEVYHEFVEPLAKSVDRAISLTIPANCELGAAVDVTVYATDAALDRRAQQVSTPYTLVDKTRPTMRGATVARPSGPYFAGDTIDFVVDVSDNHSLRTIVWEARPSGMTDSMPAPGRGGEAKIRVPVASGWSGPLELRYVVKDAAGLVSDTIVSSPGGIGVFPTIERPATTMTAEALGAQTTEVAIDAVRNVAYLMQNSPSRVVAVSLSSMQVVSTIPLALNPGGIDLTASGDSLLVAFPETRALGVIDLREAVRRLELMPLFDPGYPMPRPGGVFEARALANGKAFMLVSGDYMARIVELDLATGDQRYRFDLGSGGGVNAVIDGSGPVLVKSLDGTVLSVRTASCLQRYDAPADRVDPCVVPQALGVVTGVDAPGQRFMVGLDVYDASWTRLRRVELLPADAGAGTTLSPNGRDVYLPYKGSLVRASAADGRIINRQRTPIVVTAVRMSPNGQFVLVTGWDRVTGEPSLAVVDIR